MAVDMQIRLSKIDAGINLSFIFQIGWIFELAHGFEHSSVQMFLLWFIGRHPDVKEIRPVGHESQKPNAVYKYFILSFEKIFGLGRWLGLPLLSARGCHSMVSFFHLPASKKKLVMSDVFDFKNILIHKTLDNLSEIKKHFHSVQNGYIYRINIYHFVMSFLTIYTNITIQYNVLTQYYIQLSQFTVCVYFTVTHN